MQAMANPLGRLTALVREIQEEMKQVSWPAREELIGSAVVVFVGVTILAVFISACDVVLSNAIQRLLRFGG